MRKSHPSISGNSNKLIGLRFTFQSKTIQEKKNETLRICALKFRLSKFVMVCRVVLSWLSACASFFRLDPGDVCFFIT